MASWRVLNDSVPDPVAASDNEDEFDMVNSIILTSSLLVLVVVGYFINTHRLKNLPESGAAIGLGILVGVTIRTFGLGQEAALLDPTGRFGDIFFFVLLPPIIFEAGMSLQTNIFIDNLGAILTFAVLGTIISALVVSTGMRFAAHTGFLGLVPSQRLELYCHLFGALISATDPVATIALFGGSRFRADPLLHSLINGESVLNDAVALVLFITLSHHLDKTEVPSLIGSTILGHFLVVLVGSVAAGIGAGALVSWRFRKSHSLTRFPDYEISAILLAAYLTYTVSQLVGLSGIVALFFFGVILSHYNWYNLSESSKVASKVAFGSLSKLAEACVFIYLGIVTALSFGRFHWHFGLVGFSMILITVARATHIFPLSMVLNNFGRERKISRSMQTMMWISGLRGAIAFAMSLRIPCSGGNSSRHGSDDCRNSDLLVTTTISIVMLTTLIVGSAMERIATVLGVIEPEDQASLSEPLAASSNSSSQLQGGGSRESGEDLGRLREDVGFIALPAEASPSFGGGHTPPEHGGGPEPPSRVPSVYGLARSIYSERFSARGHLYKAFAQFDLDVLQPALGGPCRMRMGPQGMMRELETFDKPNHQGVGYTDQPGFQRLLAPPSEDETPCCSRSVIFE